MSNRTLRVNELIQRELGDILRKRHQAEAVAITINAVDIAPDLRDGRVHVAILGDAEFARQKLRWLRSISRELTHELGRRIVLKYMPRLTYTLDTSTARGNRVLGILDEIDATQGPLPPPDDDTPRS
ncbi:MAG: ribosome-binding factor A [Opitutaceae bacterium]|jgi:ribosome-binding factor A|nr:ribosome-binding factor A [Opitutaceae bacterium]